MYSTETLTRAIRDIAVRVDENRAVAAEQPRHERSRQQQRGPRQPLRTSVFRRRALSAAANAAAATRAAAARAAAAAARVRAGHARDARTRRVGRAAAAGTPLAARPRGRDAERS